MHEFVPELRRVPSDAYHDDQDEEYDVLYFWPSRNELSRRPTFYVEWDEDTSSESTTYDEPMIMSPTYTVDTDFSFPDTVDDNDISSMGYSKFFRMGLWAQPSRITKHLDVFIAKAMAKLRSFRRHFARPNPRREA
ncbi:hypothetical protein BD414DRAFT_474244 [Trametes punicea]|nr:hypothetical protein BD414DRAFT_474244 [Trametes punicea]